jgi:hypothetical protein
LPEGFAGFISLAEVSDENTCFHSLSLMAGIAKVFV